MSYDLINLYLDIGCPASKINLGFAFYAKYFTVASDCSSPLGCALAPAEDPSTGADTLASGAWTFEKSHLTPVDTSRLAISNDGTCGPEKMTKCATGCCSQYGNCGTTKEHCHGACFHSFGTGCTDNDVFGSWQSAMTNGQTDEEQGGQYFYDKEKKLFWTWDTPALISRKFDEIVRELDLGGVMAWSLGEDSFDWSHIHQIAKELGNGGGYETDGGQQQGQNPKRPSPQVTTTKVTSTTQMDQGVADEESEELEEEEEEEYSDDEEYYDENEDEEDYDDEEYYDEDEEYYEDAKKTKTKTKTKMKTRKSKSKA
jgi:chitinase